MTKLKTVAIKRKDRFGNVTVKEYVEVNTRIKYFRENYQNYSLESDIIELTDESIIIKAVIRNEDNRILATGYAQEYKNNSFINKTSFIENCETSAWGRCLANFGIGVDSSVATYEEVSNAIKSHQQTPPPESQVEQAIKKTFNAKNLLSSDDAERWSKAVQYALSNGLDKLFSMYELSDADTKKVKLDVIDAAIEYAKKYGVDELEKLSAFNEEQMAYIVKKIYQG